MAHLKSTAMYAADYREFLTLEQRKYQGTIPVEKRQDYRFLIEFENVTFRYPGSEVDVIKNLNYKFEIGERMAVVGRNGSGKTTFIKLLCRLYDVTEGCIKVNGIDIRKYDYQEYCNLFSVVIQDFTMFAFSMGENIAASKDYDIERVNEAIDKVGLQEIREKMIHGLDTCVGKEYSTDGVNFSGGEKQKCIRDLIRWLESRRRFISLIVWLPAGFVRIFLCLIRGVWFSREHMMNWRSRKDYIESFGMLRHNIMLSIAKRSS